MRLAGLVVALLVAAAALAQADPPRRKSGLWHISITSSHMPPVQVHECVERNQDDFLALSSMGEEARACSKHSVRREGANVVSETICKMNGSTVTSRGVFTGSFESAYKADMKATYRPPYEGIAETTMKMEGRWLGACKPGQKPGDTTVLEVRGVPKKR
jgi:hypothetical protein